jgi:hypothetical protein
LQLEREMFQHMPNPRSLTQSLDKSPWIASRAAVLLQRWHHRQHAVDESRDFAGRAVFEITNVND